MDKYVLKAEKITKEYNKNTKVLIGIDLEVQQGEFIAIVGLSGSGKTTLLNIIGGVDNPTSGKIIVDGNELNKMNENDKTIFRRKKISFVFQDYNLIPVLNAYENIALVEELDKKKVNEKEIDQYLKEFKIFDKKYNLPAEMSGGQQQRVAIIRAMINHPSIILADEPTGNLDSKTSELVISLLKEVSSKYKQTVLIITHSPKVAESCNRIIRIEDGKIMEEEKNEC